METQLKHLKGTLGLDILRCTTVEGVLKELTLFVLIYNLVCRVRCEAGRRQQVAPDRISFIDAWRGSGTRSPATPCPTWSSTQTVPAGSSHACASAGPRGSRS